MSKHNEVDKRLKALIHRHFPTRGRFRVLEELSGIASSKWKNFYYEKQSANPEMLSFWCKNYTNDAIWLTTGQNPPEQENYPFLARMPSKGSLETITDRLIWAISEFTAPHGDSLFSYLEQRSQGRISATDWSQVILKKIPPSADMVKVVGEARNQIFTEWIIHGRCFSSTSVDPSDSSSVKRWQESRNKEMDDFPLHLNSNK